MAQRHTRISMLVAVILLIVMPVVGVAEPARVRQTQTGGELLVNPGFEGLSCPGVVPPDACLPRHNFTHAVHIQDGILRDNIETPEGWVTWWREQPPEWTQPEVVLMPSSNPTYTDPNLPRIHSGAYAAKVFGPAGKVDGGLYQVVTGLQPGATVQLTAYVHTWSCNSMQGDRGTATTCGDQFGMWAKLGIEPNGLADPFAPSVIWSAEYYVPDYYQRIGPLTAQVGANGTIVVLLRSWAKWPVAHNDAYWDDASLTYVGPVAVPTNTPPPPPTVDPFAPTRAPLATPTPRPDGAIVHIVQPGDTLFGISLMYGVDVEQIRQLNAASIGPGGLIVVGQELVIALPAVQPTAVPPTATPAEVSAAEANSGPAPASAPTGASICVLAYHDRNGDTFRNDAVAEELLPNVEFAVADASGVVARYTTDGINEPHCFAVAPGAYRVIETVPVGYAPSGQAEQSVALVEGTTLTLQFGNVRGEGAEAATEAPVEAMPMDIGASAGSQGSSGERIFRTIAKVSGILVLLLAILIAVLFVLNRRRM